MKIVKGAVMVMMLFGAFLFVHGTALAEDGAYDGCYMTGGGKLAAAASIPAKPVIVDYGLFLTCPGPEGNEGAGIEESIQLRNPINVLSVIWSGRNRFAMNELCQSACYTDVGSKAGKASPSILTGFTFHGSGYGTYNWYTHGYSIEFWIVDNRMAGSRDWARFIIKNPQDEVVLDVQGYIVTGGQTVHCPRFF